MRLVKIHGDHETFYQTTDGRFKVTPYCAGSSISRYLLRDTWGEFEDGRTLRCGSLRDAREQIADARGSTNKTVADLLARASRNAARHAVAGEHRRDYFDAAVLLSQLSNRTRVEATELVEEVFEVAS